MVLNKEELDHLKKLARISHIEDEDKFLGKLDNIIQYLDKIKELDFEVGRDESEEFKNDELLDIENPLRVLEGVRDFDNKEGILDNVEHEKINNSVVVKSVLG